MVKEINFKQIEKKWQEKWEKKRVFEAKEGGKKKFYVLEMFPYPSSDGLHMGHALNYTIGDIYARFKRMLGFNVLYPMGFDALGLPAENAAIKAGKHPKKYTENSIKNFIKQQKALGLSYDWSRMIKTNDSSYYKWDQWIFLKMLEKGLAFRKKSPVNFCRKCQTVLANEQVHNGKCWRHEDTDIEIRYLEQWFFKITKYANELYEKINSLKNWPERTKAMQKNWIGKSHGVEIDFEIKGEKWPIFTTRPDTIYGVTFMVISAQHPRLMELVTKNKESEINEFLKKIKSTSEKEIENMEKEGVFTGSYALNPLTKEKVPVYAGNFVLADYGSGMVMAVPAHDQRDFEFAKKYHISIKVVIQPETNCIIIHGYNLRDREKLARGEPPQNKRHWIPWIKKNLEAQGIKTSTPLMPENWNPNYKDWKNEFEKLNINENSVLIGHSAGAGFLVRWLGESKKRIKKLILVAPAIIHGKGNKNFEDLLKFDINKDIKNFAKKIIIFVSDNECDSIKESVKIYSEALNIKPTELHGKGHFIKKHMDTEEFPELFEAVNEINTEKISRAYTDEGILINSREFNNTPSKKAIEKITKYIEKNKLGRKKIQYKLKDWLLSRQRYWGTPIPVIYCEKCGIVPVPEKDLPVELPERVEFGKGNPLETAKSWLNVKCPKCGSNAQRETDTMDTFVNSSWYFLRYTDPRNNKEIFDKKKAKYWMPIDQYIGGAEHACMHLIYFRFYTKFLRDLGLIAIDEPAINLFHQGMLHGPDGFVMSKSRGNVINPLEMVDKYSADILRLFLVSVASPDKDFSWSNKGIEGALRFVKKIFDYFRNIKIGKSSKKIESKINKSIKGITEDIENFRYNLAVINLRNLFDSISGEEIAKKDLEDFLIMLHPFCPHITEELWEKIGNKNFISLEKWPKADEKKIDKKLEEEEKFIEKLIVDTNLVFRLMKEKQGKETKKVYIYVIPKEKEIYKKNLGMIKKKIFLDPSLFAVNDKDKYDPQNKAGKAKPGKPAIYLE